MDENKELTVVEKVEQEAKNCFKQGLNCSECVMTAMLNNFETGLPAEVITLATGFGGGMGHTKNTCGAITGAVMALSAMVGRKNPMAKETMPERIAELQDIYAVVGKMVNEIKDEYGTLICSELSDPLGDWEGKARKRNCMQMITYCAGLAAKYAEENKR
ncbi:C-GCAxxG-C-C family protein [Anaerotignum sp.]|nr:C-GCAxxG-C-C family protein [Anaerotignum sp.]MCI5678642.1 C-GCAxxG-C-C family protein [Bacteroidales bacterium]MDY3926694.1 C-GCAxxG-C-C family protein [Anaerotignum sp.]